VIAREWKCLCPPVHRDGFLAHLHGTGVADTSLTPGFAGYQILTRELDGMVEFTLTTYWATLDAMRPYVGEDLEVAVLYPGDERFAIVPETAVRLYEVAGAGFPVTGG
jgi:heme-degrading monooxygenase HmoA